jgi:hypothetical protein
MIVKPYWPGTQRVQQAARLGGQQPLSGWIALILYVVLGPAFWVYLQVSLNEVWRSEADALPGQAPLPERADVMPPRLEDGDQARQKEAAAAKV